MQIRGLQWSPDDSKLVSCGIDGGVYEWLLGSLTRGGECVVKGTQYTAVVFSPDMKSVIVASSDNTLKEISPQVRRGITVKKHCCQGPVTKHGTSL